MIMRKFWLWDSDPEDEIYETLAWDLPGYQHKGYKKPKPASKRRGVPSAREKRT